MNRNLINVILLLIISTSAANAQITNSLSKVEKQKGWRLLFDGKTFDGWQKLADAGWTISNGELLAQASTDGKQKDIITTEQFQNFELSLQFKISKETNSGIKYLVINNFPGQEGTFLGLEYQILDDVNYKYPERGVYRSLSSLYDLIPANKEEAISLNSWYTARIIVDGNHIEHWLNGKKVVEYDRSQAHFFTLVNDSKYKNLKDFGKMETGHILLQNEGTPVAFRNIKIKVN
jgi:hypothetical protein